MVRRGEDQDLFLNQQSSKQRLRFRFCPTSYILHLINRTRMASEAETDTVEDLAQPGYWDARYANEKPGDPTHEWFRNYEDLSAFLERRLKAAKPPHTNPRILHLGAGKSVRVY